MGEGVLIFINVSLLTCGLDSCSRLYKHVQASHGEVYYFRTIRYQSFGQNSFFLSEQNPLATLKPTSKSHDLFVGRGQLLLLFINSSYGLEQCEVKTFLLGLQALMPLSFFVSL